jgi:hypothetical protein
MLCSNVLMHSDFMNHFTTNLTGNFWACRSGLDIEYAWVIIRGFITPALRARIRVTLWFPPIRAAAELTYFPFNNAISYFTHFYISVA